MFRWLGRVPRWLTLSLFLASTTALTTAQLFASVLHGWPWKLAVALTGASALLSGGLSELARWQEKQDSRLKIWLETEPAELSIPAYQDSDRVICSIVGVEEIECMASLPTRSARKSVRGFRADALDLDGQGGATGSGYQVKPSSTSVMAVLKLAQRRESGEDLTAEEEEILVTGQAQVAKTMSSIGMSTILGSFIRPETRTAEQYSQEVAQYLAAYADFLDKQLRQEYCKRRLGLLRLILVNPEDRTFDDVQVEVFFPGPVTAVDPDRISQRISAPARPRKFGTGLPITDFGFDSMLAPNLVISRSVPSARRGPKIDNAGSARVTYDAVRLRPRARVALDDIVLS